MSALHADALQVLRGWTAPGDAQEQLRQQFVAHLEHHPDGAWRHCLPAHLTASLIVLDPAGERVLLNLHGKGRFWGQFGGHCEPGDASLAGAALREGIEESGVASLQLLDASPVDLDRHLLSARFGGCGEHLDVRYAAVASPEVAYGPSAESHDVRWFPVDALPGESVDDLRRLVEAARAVAREGVLAQRSSALSALPASSASSELSGSSASGGRSHPAAAETPSR